MNEYLSRHSLTQVDRVKPLTPGAVPAVQPISSQHPADQHAAPSTREERAGNALAEDDLASAAEYAKMHARVADILADLRSSSATTSVDDAEAGLQAMLPAPLILVPLPPASREAVESAVELGKRIAEQASYAHAAQAHVKRGTVDQILATVA